MRTGLSSVRSTSGGAEVTAGVGVVGAGVVAFFFPFEVNAGVVASSLEVDVASVVVVVDDRVVTSRGRFVNGKRNFPSSV